MEGKKYFSLFGPDIGSKYPWSIGVKKYTEDPYFKGNFGTTVAEYTTRTYKTLEEALVDLKELQDE